MEKQGKQEVIPQKAFELPKTSIERVRTAFASDAVAGLKKNTRVIGLTMGQFSLINLIRACIEKTGGKADVMLCTWAAGLQDGRVMRGLLDKSVVSDFKMVVDRSFGVRHANYADMYLEMFGKDAIRSADVHAKFALIETDEWKISIRTSMNLNQNKRIESFEVEEGEQVFSFMKQLFVDVFEKAEPGYKEKRRDSHNLTLGLF